MITSHDIVSFSCLITTVTWHAECKHVNDCCQQCTYFTVCMCTLMVLVSDIAIFVLKRDVKLQLTNSDGTETVPVTPLRRTLVLSS